MSQLAFAVNLYAETHEGQLPPVAVTDNDGKPLLSWRVLVLPYIEEEALFREFHLDEPWNSPHNIGLLDRIPSTYAPFRGRKDNPRNTTYYRVFTGKNTPFGEQARLRDIQSARGLSNTIMIVEAGEPVLWSKPDELEYSPDKPLPPLGGVFPNDVRIAMFDGHFQTFPLPLDESAIRKMIRLRDE